jgi:type II secretion system protein G
MDVWAKQKGFTIVELLIVIVVIGILAAITVVAYNGVQNRANDIAIQSDLNNIAKKIRVYQAENGAYPTGWTQLSTLKLKATKAAYGNHFDNGTGLYNLVYCWPNAANPDSFAVVASGKSGSVFEYTPATNSVRKASYAFTGGSVTICSNAGNPMDSSSNRDWFYDNGSWQS